MIRGWMAAGSGSLPLPRTDWGGTRLPGER